MANKTINDFALKSSPIGTDELLIQETAGGTTMKVTVEGLGGRLNPTNTVLVNVKSDFPAPVGGNITLAADTQYVIGADISLGTDVFICSEKSCMTGNESILTTLTSTSTGDLFTMVDVTTSINNLTIEIPNGRIFNFSDTGSRILRCKELVVNCDQYGLFSSTSNSIIRFNNCAGTIASNGLSFVGDFRNLFWDTSAITINAGAIFSLGTATFDSIIIDIVIATLNGSSNALNGATGSANINAGGIGNLQRVVNHGVGTPLNGVTTDDDLWLFFGNDSIRDTRPDGLLSMQGNATESVIAVAGTYVLVAGTWTMENATQFSGTAAGRLTYNGSNDVKLPITFACSLEPASGGSQDLSMEIAINGSVIAGSKRTTRTAAGAPTPITLIWQDVLTTGDYVEAWVTNDDGTTNVLVSSAISRIN